MQISCPCPRLPQFWDYVDPKQITVTDGAISDITLADGGQSYSNDDYYTIPEVFAKIQDAIVNHYYKMDVSYDATYGFPTNLFLDFRANAFNDVLGITISNFVDLSS